MPEELKAWLIGGLLIGVVLGIAIPIIIKDLKNSKLKNKTKEELYALEEERLNDEGEITTVHAEVTDMICGAKAANSYIYKYPDVKKFFVITFKKDNGDELEIPVVEEMYDGFEIGLRGTLTLVDGKIISFEPDGE